MHSRVLCTCTRVCSLAQESRLNSIRKETTWNHNGRGHSHAGRCFTKNAVFTKKKYHNARGHEPLEELFCAVVTQDAVFNGEVEFIG